MPLLSITLATSLSLLAAPQERQNRPTPQPPTLGLENGTQNYSTNQFLLQLGKDSQVALELNPRYSGGFDFLPSDRLEVRSADRYYHLGDLNLRIRTMGEEGWTDASTAAQRKAIRSLPTANGELATSDLTPTLPAGLPVKIVRSWISENGSIVLRFDLTNDSSKSVEIGALGIPMPFNNIISGRSLDEAHARCSFVDPYIGMDGGYLQVSKLTGTGKTLLAIPVGKTPLEAYRLLNEPMRPNQTFEGVMEWMVHSKAYAQDEWKQVKQWNEPTQAVLAPGQTRTYAIRLTLAPELREVESTLEKNGRPVAVGLPGYVVPMDQPAKLFLKYGKPVKEFSSDPPSSLIVAKNNEGQNGWNGYTVQGKTWGRSRLTVKYSDGTEQTVHYYIIKPSAEAVSDMGRFLTTKAWFNDDKDPFGRAPAAISYDKEANTQVFQDSRVWIAGLGDEGGSGNWVAHAMKVFGQPNADEVAKLDQFVEKVLWGNLQFKEGPNKFGVRKSVFYYEPSLVPNFKYDSNRNWTSWTSWNKRQTDDIGRGYNYPHVVAAYWSLYRIARNYPGLTKQNWQWYLDQAYGTTEFMTSRNDRGRDRVGYWRLGLMEGDIFVALLEDLKREGWKEKHDLIESRMRLRADRWKNEAYPFGSEMPWDSTGQEEVYAWCKYFGYDDKALVSLNSILAYMPTVPHWGYNGNARRYWDFLYGGKLSRIERQIHHYGSGLNAIPVLRHYRENPSDLYLLRVGYGGTMGAISNIDQDGFASAAFHSFPSTLKWDAYSGDYGPNFFGHAFNIGTYVVQTPNFGWQAFGGVLKQAGGKLIVEPKDSFRKRVYLAPLGLFLLADAGTIQSVEMDPKTNSVKVNFDGASTLVKQARLRLEQPALTQQVGSYRPTSGLATDAGAYSVPLGSGTTSVNLAVSK